ncbi:hypothetical protein KSC_014260 [Ktedonobacter sp. SOSP1-52]|uniref:hypothetical protein n=1 Tax=Ktedonobacter sp. SOSP1-52 TaxID=2778366 RepID=UPI001916384A|nr:hypothetical protein [Ktedonobacter sp. SOSP1-52]GHO62534.1 hypothetical protein KSC_014260 [Ktedonobacter sp. SOSP1-52]
MAKRRIMETGVWNVASVFPGGLLRGADGYVHNLQVRLLHALTTYQRAMTEPVQPHLPEAIDEE